jgi:hypothetical protein
MSCHFISYGMLLMMILFDIKLIRLVLSRCLSSLRGDLDLDPLLEDRLTGDLDLDLDNDLKESFFFLNHDIKHFRHFCYFHSLDIL